MKKALITTFPFAARDRRPLDLLEQAGVEYLVNPLEKRLTEQELAELAVDCDLLIAGTEPITELVFSRAPRLKMISRVGIGLDGVDLLAAERRGITVSYTPDAPAAAVAELTVGMMLSLLRSLHLSNRDLHRGEWRRHFGRRLAECTVGIIGAGRIGARVIGHLGGFSPRRILVNDLDMERTLDVQTPFAWRSKETIYRQADIISLHLPLTAQTRNLIGRAELAQMRPDALLINTARGGIVNEADLYEAMQQGRLGGAALDVFVDEPYSGRLREIDRCLLSAHIGSMSVDCRARMEIEATEEAIRFVRGEPLRNAVPQAEYEIQRGGA